MQKKQFEILISEYGKEKAEKAAEWFCMTSIRNAIKVSKQAQYCIDNEYCWF
jgi:hypothetical protein